jgi:hypothetical protein
MHLGWQLIKRLRPEQKFFLIKKSKKLENRKTRYNKREKRNRGKNSSYTANKKKKFKPINLTMSAPENFCITNNTSEVLAYFQSIINVLKKKHQKINVFFDLENVKYISVGTVMYMLAILRNLKNNTYRKISYSGNRPADGLAKKIFEESGFLSYVTSRNIGIKPNSQKIQIRTGKSVDSITLRDICIFVNTHFNTKLNFTFHLYAILLEIVNNTVQHAYSRESIFMVNQWYLYAEESGDEIEFVLLDTGEGIPATVNKKINEKLPIVKNLVGDSQLIKSALKGEQRSQTKKGNRGKGLPRVAEAFIEGNLVDLSVYSGKGCCRILDEKNIICEDYDEHFHGTLFTWKIKKPS